MRTYEQIRDEQARPVSQAIANAERDLGEAERTLAGWQGQVASLEDQLQELTRQHRALDGPQATLRNEISDLEQRLKELQRQVESKRDQLRGVEGQAEGLRAEITSSRARLNTTNKEAERAGVAESSRRAAVNEARGRLAVVRREALRTYLSECFDVLQKSATEGGARERYLAVQASYEGARHSDAGVMKAHEERVELRRLLETAQVPSIREGLSASLRRVEGELVQRFPGLLDPPPPAEDQVALETYYWYAPEDDVTRVLVPVPESCWRTPPESREDPRGARLCLVIWAFVSALGDPVPSAELEDELVVLELHGDHSTRISEKLFEVRTSAGATVAFVPSPLPTELREVIV